MLTGLLVLSCVSRQNEEDELIIEEDNTAVFEEDPPEAAPVFYQQDLENKLWLRASKTNPFNVEGYYFLPKGRWLLIGGKDRKALFWSFKDNIISLSWFDRPLEEEVAHKLQLSSLTGKSLTFIDHKGKELRYQYIQQDTLAGSWELIFAHGDLEFKKKVWIEFLPSQGNNKGVLLGSTGINSFRLAYENRGTWKMSSAIAHTRESGDYEEERFERHFLALFRNINRIIKANSLIFCYTASQLELVFRRQ